MNYLADAALCVRFAIGDSGIGVLTPVSDLATCPTQLIIDYLLAQASADTTLRGLLVEPCDDVRPSMIRLSALIDHLCKLGLPVGVVVPDPDQRRLAALLHYAQSQPVRAVFFANRATALLFLASTNGPPLSQALQ